MELITETVVQPFAAAADHGSAVWNDAGEHMIAAFVGKSTGPTLIAVGSLHGNEPGGVTALASVAEKLTERADRLNGRV